MRVRQKTSAPLNVNRRFHVQNIAGIEMKNLSSDHILVGIFKGERGWGGEMSFARGHVERGVQLAGQCRIVGKQRKWISSLLRGGIVHQFQRPVCSSLSNFLRIQDFTSAPRLVKVTL